MPQKMHPRKGESRAEMLARLGESEGTKEEGPRNPPRRSGRSNGKSAPRSRNPRESGNSINKYGGGNRSSVSAPYEAVQPGVIEAGYATEKQVGYDGTAYTSVIYGDFIFQNHKQLYYMELQAPNFNTLKPGGGVADVPVDQAASFLTNNLYSLMYVQAMERRNWTPVGLLTTPGDWTGWLSNYATAFTNFRLIEALLDYGAFNATSSKIQSAIASSLPRLNLDLERLAAVPVPVGFKSMLDRLCGVFAPDDASADICTTCIVGTTAGTQLDISTVAGISAILSNGESALTSILGAGPESGVILQTLGVLYGTTPLKPKKVYRSSGLWSQWMLNGGFMYRNTTTGFTWMLPAPAGYSGLVPIFMPKGENAPYLQTYLRNQVYSNQNGVGIASTVGLVGQPTNNGSYVQGYSQAGATFSYVNAFAGPRVTTYTADDINFWWAPLAGAADATTTADVRIVQEGYEVYYIAPAEMGKQTIAVLMDIFLRGKDPDAEFLK